jgi:pilus assembly protein CpaB
MNSRALLFFLFALLLAGGTTYAARSWLASQQARPAPAAAKIVEQPSVRILVAANDLATGGFVRAQDLKWQSWPDDQVTAQYVRKPDATAAEASQDPLQALVGGVVRQRIAAGEPVTSGRVIKPGDRGFLAAVLTQGKRAVSVPVTATSGVAGFVFPGDRVDLILSHTVKDPNAPSAPGELVTETVLTDIRVLAVDQATADQENKPILAKTMTFEVTPKQVEVIGVMSGLGTLSLSLRSLEEEQVDLSGLNRVASVSHTIDSQVSPLITHHRSKSEGPHVTVLRGGGAPRNVSTATPGATASGAAQ